MNVRTRNYETFLKLCQQAEQMTKVVATLPDFTKARASSLNKERIRAMANGNESDKHKSGLQAMDKFIANVEGEVADHCFNAPERFLNTQEWFAKYGASRYILDHLSSGINRFNKAVRTTDSMEKRVSAYIEMKALIVKMQAEYFVEQEVKSLRQAV